MAGFLLEDEAFPTGEVSTGAPLVRRGGGGGGGGGGEDPCAHVCPDGHVSPRTAGHKAHLVKVSPVIGSLPVPSLPHGER